MMMESRGKRRSRCSPPSDQFTWKNMLSLPPDWTQYTSSSYGTVVEAPGISAVSVDETARNFALGMTTVRDSGAYSGRGWKENLFADAIAALQRRK